MYTHTYIQFVILTDVSLAVGGSVYFLFLVYFFCNSFYWDKTYTT